MPFKNFLEPGQRFYVACLLLALFAGGLRFADINRAGFVVHDARYADLAARNAVSGGLHRYLQDSTAFAMGQGRVGFVFSYSLFIGPYLVNAQVRPILITIVQLLAYVSLCFFLAHYMGAPAAWMVFLALLCFAPHPGQHYPITSDPIGFHAPIAIFFLGYNLHLAAREWQLRPVWRWTIHGITFLCILAAVCVYEALYVSLAVVEAVAVYSLLRDARRQSASSRPIRRVLLAESPVLGAFAFYGLAYVVFRRLYPTVYSGTDTGGGFHFAASVQSVFVYAITGLPGENLSYGLGWQFASQVPGGWQTILSRQFGWQVFVLTVGVAMVFWIYIRHAQQLHQGGSASRWAWLPDLKNVKARRAAGLRVAGVAVAIAFAAQVPLSLIPRYRDHTEQWAPYVPSFFAFVGFSVALPALLVAIAGWLRTWRIVAILFVASAALLAAVNREASELVLAHQEKEYASSKLVDLLLKSKPFAAIPEGAVVVAPDLWDELAAQWEYFDRYWTEYIRLHFGRHIRMIRTIPDSPHVPSEPGQMYYLEKQGAGTAGEPVLVLSDLFRKNIAGPSALRSRSITIISARPLNDAGVVFQQAAAESPLDTPGVVVSGIPEAAPLVTQFDGHSFFATVEVPDTFFPGTAYVVSESAALSKNKLDAFKRDPYVPMRDTEASALLGLQFGKGFSVLETSGSRRWHWSNGQSGEAGISVWNRLNHPLDGVFEACIATGYQKPDKLDLEFDGRKESVPLDENRCPLRRKWTFSPGENQIVIHSYAPRLNSGADPRYIVFGVYDWKLTPVLR